MHHQKKWIVAIAGLFVVLASGQAYAAVALNSNLVSAIISFVDGQSTVTQMKATQDTSNLNTQYIQASDAFVQQEQNDITNTLSAYEQSQIAQANTTLNQYLQNEEAGVQTAANQEISNQEGVIQTQINAAITQAENNISAELTKKMAPSTQPAPTTSPSTGSSGSNNP